MADATSQPSTPPTPEASPPTATPPATPPKGEELDLSKLSGEQLNKVLENPELFKQPRIAELLQAQKDLKKLQADQDKKTNETLAEQKKFEELAKKHATENETLKQQIQSNKIDQALTGLLVKEQVVDLDGALKLIDKSNITVDENGNVQGVDEALTSLKTDKAYLFNNQGGQPTVGSPSNPTNSQAGQPGRYKFKESQITPEFYKANEKEILAAYRLGQVEPDGPPQ